MIDVGHPAPLFTLDRDGGTSVSLASFLGQWVVVYFYPRDATPGCTKQAIAFTEMGEAFAKRNAVVIGISPDGVAAHDKFVEKHQLSVILAADENRDVIQAYDVWREKNMYGRRTMGVERSTFLVDSDGIIRAVWRKVRVPGHSDKVMEALIEEQEKDNK